MQAQLQNYNNQNYVENYVQGNYASESLQYWAANHQLQPQEPQVASAARIFTTNQPTVPSPHSSPLNQVPDEYQQGQQPSNYGQYAYYNASGQQGSFNSYNNWPDV